MKKILLLIIGCVLLFITYDFYETKKETTKNQDDQKDISYRIEENLIEEENTQEDVTEDEFTSYISEINNEVEEITNQESLTEEEQNVLKNTFITLTDFIFYNGTIKGKTFNELTTSAKESVISLYEKIDSKIESKIPNYKETIKETSKKTYKNIKEKLTTLKNDLLLKYKTEIGEENYQDQEELIDESINTMKESFSPVIDTIVDKSKEIYESAKDKTSSWYQEWKEENRR